MKYLITEKQLKNLVKSMDEISKEIDQVLHLYANDRLIMTEHESIDFVDMSDKQDVDHKPEGLWYAMGTEWINWVRSEMPEWEYDNVFVLEINKDRVKKLSSYEDIEEFTKQYGRKHHGFVMIDWRKVAKEYSGIEIIPYVWSARMKFNWYYTWDVASGCIWGSDGIKSIEKIKI